MGGLGEGVEVGRGRIRPNKQWGQAVARCHLSLDLTAGRGFCGSERAWGEGEDDRVKGVFWGIGRWGGGSEGGGWIDGVVEGVSWEY